MSTEILMPKPPVTLYPLRNGAKALQQIKDEKVLGKIVLQIDD